MCQINVEMVEDGNRKKIMDGVIRLEVKGNGVVLNTFFEEPLEVPEVEISSIDFMGGSVVLKPLTEPTFSTNSGGKNE